MLFRQAFLDGIRSGAVTVAYRRWRRPSVRAGGRLLTPVGLLAIGAVEPVDPAAISDGEAARAGYTSRDELLRELEAGAGDIVYRIELGPLVADPREALRERAAPPGDELDGLRMRLARLDSRSPSGPWTRAVLRLLAERPGVRAADLCRAFGQDKATFKTNVRKLKNLGLTVSLETGYRLSPRGRAFLESEAGGRDGAPSGT
jgi:hypothetical protein